VTNNLGATATTTRTVWVRDGNFPRYIVGDTIYFSNRQPHGLTYMVSNPVVNVVVTNLSENIEPATGIPGVLVVNTNPAVHTAITYQGGDRLLVTDWIETLLALTPSAVEG